MTKPTPRAYHDFDLTELPPGCRTPGTPAFEDAVRAHFLTRHSEPGRLTSVLVKQSSVELYSFPDEDEALAVIVPMLKSGQLTDAVSMLESLTKDRQAGYAVYYNLGIAYAELAQYDEAVLRLRRAVQLDPSHVHSWVGLGNALDSLGKGEQALEALQRAAELGPQDGYARRNLGGALLNRGRAPEAIEHLGVAHALMPEDDRALFGLVMAHKAAGQLKDADAMAVKYLSSFPGGAQAEEVRRLRTELAHLSMRGAAGGILRMDVVMYMLGAFKTFEKYRETEKPVLTKHGRRVPPSVNRLAMEVAMKGRTGLDINNPDAKYTLDTLPGEFTGLHLLSLMYVAFKELDPNLDVGVDFTQEYAAAKSMAAMRPAQN